MGVARKWHFSTSGGAANLGVSGDLFEHRGSGIPLLGITSLFIHKLTGLINNNDEVLDNILCFGCLIGYYFVIIVHYLDIYLNNNVYGHAIIPNEKI